LLLNNYLVQYAMLELLKIRHEATRRGLSLEQQRLTIKADDIAARAGKISNLRAEIAAIKEKQKAAPWYQFGEKMQLNSQLEEVQRTHLTAIDELKTAHGVNPEGAIDAATKLHGQIEKAKELAAGLPKNEEMEKQQRELAQNFTKACHTDLGQERIGLARNFYQAYDGLEEKEMAALKGVESRFQQIAAAIHLERPELQKAKKGALDRVGEQLQELSQKMQVKTSGILKDLREHPFFMRPGSPQPDKLAGKRVHFNQSVSKKSEPAKTGLENGSAPTGASIYRTHPGGQRRDKLILPKFERMGQWTPGSPAQSIYRAPKQPEAAQGENPSILRTPRSAAVKPAQEILRSPVSAQESQALRPAAAEGRTKSESPDASKQAAKTLVNGTKKKKNRDRGR